MTDRPRIIAAAKLAALAARSSRDSLDEIAERVADAIEDGEKGIAAVLREHPGMRMVPKEPRR